jgi:hypothetical protein
MTLQKPFVACVLVLGLSGAGSAYGQQDVRVINPPQEPVNTAPLADTRPFAMTQPISGPGQTSLSTFQPFVPEGYRFIIDQMSAHVSLPPGQRVLLVGLIGPDPDQPPVIQLPLPVQFQVRYFASNGTALYELLAGSTSAHAALDPGQSFSVRSIRSKSFGQLHGFFTLQGHLVALPSPR